MRFVLRLARWNLRDCGGGPFGAAVFCRSTGRLVSVGVNRVVSTKCSLAHAEVMAVALAQRSVGTHDLAADSSTTFELYTSGQPCIQCFGMIWWSGITRLVIGARAADIEQLTGFCEGPLPTDWIQTLASRPSLPRVEVVTDVLREEACGLLSEYAAADGQNYSPGHASLSTKDAVSDAPQNR